MRIFDGHADIWYDVAQKRQTGMDNIFKNYHLERFKAGKIIGGIFIAYLEHKDDLDDEKQMIQMLAATAHEIQNNPDLFNIIKKRGDFNRGLVEEKVNVLMGVEGLRAIGTDLDWLDMFYSMGFRHASLTWNEENALATGVKGDEKRGLTEIGKKAIGKLEELGMIVDCSHANEKTFWDIYDIATKPFIASHSNAKTLCNHPRNLTDAQIKAIAQRDGLIGINAFRNFISEDENKKNMENYVNHIDYMVSLAGINHVALGFDFCEYLHKDRKDLDSNPLGLENASKAQNVIEELRKRGYKEKEIRKIAYENFMRIIETILK